MKLADILFILYPEEMDSRDIVVEQLPNQEQTIYFWNEELLGAQPTEQSVLMREAEVVDRYDDDNTLRVRAKEYPSVDELIVALWEKVVEGRTDAADALEVKRQAVKAKHPKK